MLFTATYDPEDNKLRLYASSRLDRELYDQVKALGFRWAPKQEVFVAPAWTPNREDFLLELCGEIGDEDRTLVQRAEDRAERFEDYSVKRAREAEQVAAGVNRLTEGIPLGQPILVGHHSQRRAQKDADRIESGMRKQIQLWKTSAYWIERANGAIANAKYRELPDVRYRRIKGLESEIRKIVAQYTPIEKAGTIMQQNWRHPDYPNNEPELHVWCSPGGRGGYWVPAASLERMERGYARWIAHLENRLAYERAMLGEQGGIKAEAFEIEPGGRVLVGREWAVVKRVNRKDGEIVSFSVAARWSRVVGIEEVEDYREPSVEDRARVAEATKLPPMCNYRIEGGGEMTLAQYKRIPSEYKRGMHQKPTDQTGLHRLRCASGGYGQAQDREKFRHSLVPIFLTDQKEVLPPPPSENDVRPKLQAEAAEPVAWVERKPDRADYAHLKAEQVKEQLGTGVKAVSSPDLFETPYDLVERMVEMAGIRPGQKVLEPSAGTGRIADALRDAGAEVVYCELSSELAGILSSKGHRGCWGDFIERFSTNDPQGIDEDEVGRVSEPMRQFDAVVMNPPFSNGRDIAHIRHAVKLTRPGGIVVAICAGGPRQKAALEPLASYWEPLPPGTFHQAGTEVSSVLLTIEVEN